MIAICSILIMIITTEIVAEKLPVPQIPQSKDNNQPFIFVLSPQLSPNLARSQDSHIFRLPSIESLPSMLTSIVKARNNNQEQRQGRNNKQSSFKASPVDPLMQRQTTVIDMPVLGDHNREFNENSNSSSQFDL